MCSTPFGITELDTILRCAGSDVDNECSTPFGITELDTSRGLRPYGVEHECSTPFGITELDTSVPSVARAVVLSSAQRLSASLNSTLPARLTPQLPYWQVLNAFRHH